MAIQRSVVIRLVADVHGMTAGMDTAERSATKVERRVAAMTRAVKAAAAESAQAAQRVATARQAEAAATERVAVVEERAVTMRAAAAQSANRVGQAEARLAEVRAAGTAEMSSRVSAAEQRVSAARSQAEAAARRIGTAEERLAELRAGGASASASELSAAERRVEQARQTAAAAANRVGQAEARLQELRAASSASASEVAAAEARLVEAQRVHQGVATSAAAAEQRLTAAQQEQSAAATAVASAEERAAAATNAQAAAAERSMARTRAWNNAAGKMAMIGGTIGVGLGLAVKQFMDFDEAMGGVRANLDRGDLGKLPQLTAAIKEAGAASVYSSVEAANAAEELVKAGVSAQDVIGGGLTGALGLAAAGGIGLARAAEVSAMAMTQFKLGGEDATHIADVLAGGALASTASVDSLAMALAQGGGVAQQFGAHIEDTVGTLAMFDQNALRGSDAGTSMKTMLLSLANPSKAAAAAMRDLGINAFTAQGEFVGLAGLQDQLKEKTKGLTQEQRQQAFATIFGSDAVRAANAMYGDTKGIRAWTESVNKSGLASQVAAAKLNNAKGDLEALKGDLENILIGAGEGANGPIRGLIQNVDKLVSAFGELPSGVQSGVVQIAAFGSAGLLAAAGVIKMVNTIRSIRSAVMTAAGALRDGVGAFNGWVRAGSSSGTMLAGLRGRAVQAGSAIRNMGVVGKVGLGMLAAGFIAAGVAAATSGREVENYGRQTERLGLDLQSAAKGGAGLNDIFKDMSVAAAKDSSMSFAEGMRSLKGATNEATDGVDRFAAGIFKQTGLAKGALGPIDAVKGRLAGVGRHLADLANNGNMAEASAQFKVLSDEAKKYGVDQKDLIRMMPEWSAVLDSSAYKQQSATEKAKADAAARQKQEESLKAVVDAYKNLNNVLLQQEAGQDAALAAVDAADKALQENGRTLDANSEKGRANRSALRDIVQQYGEWASSVKQATGSSEQANAILAQGKKAYIDHAMSMGKSASEAKRLADELFKVGEVDTTAEVTVDGVKAAQYEVDEFGNSVARLDGSKVEIPAETPNAPQVLQTLTALGLTAKQLSSDGTKVSIPTEALKAPETRAAIMGIEGATKDAQGNVTIPTSALKADATRNALKQIDNIALQADGRVVIIPASTPNAAAVKQLLEGVDGAAVSADGRSVSIPVASPNSPATKRLLNQVEGAALSADKKSVTVPTSALGAVTAKGQIDGVIQSANAADGKVARVSIITTKTLVNEVINRGSSNAVGVLAKARGGVMFGDHEAFARGGVREDHEPQIARPTPGRVRVWAEPETQGEAYIPFANDGRRGRAKSITEYVARRFGGSVTWHADGSADDWTPDMSGIMQVVSAGRVDPSKVEDARKKWLESNKKFVDAVEKLYRAQTAQAGKTGAALVKAAEQTRKAKEAWAKADDVRWENKRQYDSLASAAKLDTTGRFMQATGQQNGLSKRFLDNIERIRKRGFPRLARSLLEQGDSDAQAIAQTLSGGALSRLKSAQAGLETSDKLADRKTRMLDDLKGISTGEVADQARAQANAQLIAMQAANQRIAWASGPTTARLEARLDVLADAIRSQPAPIVQASPVKVITQLDSRPIAESTFGHGARESQWGSVLPGAEGGW